MPISVGFEAGKFGKWGIEMDGVRALMAIWLLIALFILGIYGNPIAIGALIPLAKDAISAYIEKAKNGSGGNGHEKPDS